MVSRVQKSSKNLSVQPSSISPISKSSSDLSKSTQDLLAPNQENLDSLCLTKKRVLEGLKVTSHDLPDDFLLTQLQKDELLNSLNKRILSLRFKIATKTKSTKEKLAKQKLENITRKVEASIAEKQKLQKKLNFLKDELDKKGKSEDFIKIQGKIEETKDMTAVLREESMLKEEELKETRKDLKEIKKILNGMTEIYVNVQGKMDEKRNEINDLNLKYFEMVLGTEDLEELEEKYKEAYYRSGRIKQEKELIQKKYKKIKGIYQKLQKFPTTVEHMLEDLKELDGFIESIIDEREIERILTDSKEKIADLKDTINEPLSKKLKVLDIAERKSSEVRVKFKENEKILKDLQKEVSKIDSKPLNVTLNELVSKLANLETNNKQNLENLGNELITLKKNVKVAKLGLKSALDQNQNTDFEINQLKTKIDAGANQLKLAQNSKKSEVSLQEELKSELSTLQKKVSKVKSDSFSKDQMNNPKRLKNLVTQVTVLHEELMKKDTQILKRMRDLLKSQKETKKIQKSIEGYEQKLLRTKEEQYNRVSEQIEKKDKEIKMLKEILKGNAGEIRAKDVVLSGIKKQLEFASPRIENGVKRRDVKSK